MKLIALSAILAATTGLAAPANAQATASGWYVAAAGTLSLREDTSGTIANAPAPGSTVRIENSFEPGFGGYAALGRSFGEFRIEGELGYSRDTQDSYTAVIPPTGHIPADVEEETTRAMINGYWEFGSGAWSPFIGAGVGFARTELLFVAPRAPAPTQQPARLIDDSDEGFAYQLMGGVEVALNDRTALAVRYRWFDGGDFEGVDTRGEAVTRENAGHNIDVGLRFQF